jgi:hypothetical protein
MNETLVGAIIIVAFAGLIYYLVKRNKTPSGTGTGGGTRPPRNPPNEQEK